MIVYYVNYVYWCLNIFLRVKQENANIVKTTANFVDTSMTRCSTHRLYELKLLPLLHLLDEAHVLQRRPGEVPLLHLQSRVRLQSEES